MKKYIWLIVCIVILIGGGILFYFLNNKKQPDSKSNYNASKSGSNISLDDNSHNENSSSSQDTTDSKPIHFVEQEIASYSTVIKNKVDTNMQNNISLTCSSLNGTEIKSGDTFSFCDTVGKATPDRGYVVERHPHSADVPYIEKGKDAAVAYGSHDFKFKNNSSSFFKIYASNTTDDISIRLVKLISS